MSDEEILAKEEELIEDASEAQEANGVAEIEMGAAPAPDEVEALDARTLEELDYDERNCAGAHVPGGAVSHLRRLVGQVLQQLRKRFGQATVTSGYRNAAHNGHVGGEPNSRHRHDLFPRQPAADVTFAQGTVDQWAAEARRRLGWNEGGYREVPRHRARR